MTRHYPAPHRIFPTKTTNCNVFILSCLESQRHERTLAYARVINAISKLRNIRPRHLDFKFKK